jgi:hypothetical protein
MIQLTVILKVIGDMDDEVVTPVRHDRWTWSGAIERQDRSADSIWSHGGVLNAEPVLCLNQYLPSCTSNAGFHTSLVTPVLGVVAYQSVSIE